MILIGVSSLSFAFLASFKFRNRFGDFINLLKQPLKFVSSSATYPHGGKCYEKISNSIVIIVRNDLHFMRND